MNAVPAVTRIVDLSVVLDDATQVYPGDPVPRLEVAATIAQQGFNLLSLRIGSQSGTHVDSPYHFDADGPRLEGCGLELFVGPGVVVDCTAVGARRPITTEHIEPHLDTISGLPGAIVLLHTAWSERFWGTPAYLDHPFLDERACARMLGAGVRTVGIDALSLDATDPAEPSGFPCHHLVADARGIIAENLTNLSAIDFDPLVCLLPVRLGGDADGAPCRAVALELGSAR